MKINKDALKEYDSYMNEKYKNRKDKDNIFGVGLTNEEFIEQIKNIFLGKDWYVVDPLSTQQINEEILEEIIYRLTGKTAKRRNKELLKDEK